MSDDLDGSAPPLPDAAPSPPPDAAVLHPPVPPAPAEPAYQSAPWPEPVPPPPARYAGFWLRFVAFWIDFVLLFLAGLVTSAILRTAAGVSVRPIWGAAEGASTSFNVLETLVSIALGWLFGAFLESSGLQATPGKMALGLRVGDEDGARISFARATGRHFGKYLSLLLLGIGFVMVGLTKRKQGLHDLIAGTTVRRSGSPTGD